MPADRRRGDREVFRSVRGSSHARGDARSRRHRPRDREAVRREASHGAASRDWQETESRIRSKTLPYIERPNEPTLYYELDDYTDPWKKAPVILLQHGFSRSSLFWYSWVPYLSRFFRIVRPDLRGLGRSSSKFDLDKELGLEIYFKYLNAI